MIFFFSLCTWRKNQGTKNFCYQSDCSSAHQSPKTLKQLTFRALLKYNICCGIWGSGVYVEAPHHTTNTFQNVLRNMKAAREFWPGLQRSQSSRAFVGRDRTIAVTEALHPDHTSQQTHCQWSGATYHRIISEVAWATLSDSHMIWSVTKKTKQKKTKHILQKMKRISQSPMGWKILWYMLCVVHFQRHSVAHPWV